MSVHRLTVERIDSARPFAVALVLASDGSTPCKAGARALIEESGAIAGTIGGGYVEAHAQFHAAGACRSGRPIVLEVGLDGSDPSHCAPICGGAMRVLIDPNSAAARDAYALAAAATEGAAGGALVTTIESTGEPRVSVKWRPHGVTAAEDAFPGGQAICDAMRAGTARLISTAGPSGAILEALVEPVFAPPRLIIAGGGHIAQALARQAVLLHFAVTVIDDRPEFTVAALYPACVATVCGPIASSVAAANIDPGTYVVIVTRGHSQDTEALHACIGAPAAYVGMIGSRRKVAMMRQLFVHSGTASAEQFDRVFAPIGLDIGAVTVEEIAVSIAAELVAVRRRGSQAISRPHMARA